MAEEYARRSQLQREATLSRLQNADAFKPLILVVASEGAKILAAQNGGLGIEDLLNPFATIRGSVPIRNKDSSYNLQQFGVRFVSVDHLMPATDGHTSQIDQALSNIVKETSPGSQDMSPSQSAIERLSRQQIRSSRDIHRFFERTAASSARSPRDPPNMTPWWTKVMDELSNEGLRGQQWDMFCHPIVLLYVVSSTSEPNKEDPVKLASKMLDPKSLPGVMTSGQYNRNVPSMILLVHDNQKESVKKPESLAKKICSNTGMSKDYVRVLRLNSYSGETTESVDQPDLWTSCMSNAAIVRAKKKCQEMTGSSVLPPIPPRLGKAQEAQEQKNSSDSNVTQPNVTRKGGRLSPEDMINVQNFMSDLIQNIVVRHIESRIFTLTASVAKSKGGVRNALKSWWRKPKETTQSRTSNGDVLLYESSSVETQIRLLADLLFMVRDYGSAQHYYSMVKSDYKSDKAWLHHASCSMMMALCGFAGNGGNGSGASVQQYIEESLQPLLSIDMNSNGNGNWGKAAHYQWLITRMTLWSVALATDIFRSAPFGGIASLLRGTKYLRACAWYENARGSSLISGMMMEQAFLCTISIPHNVNGPSLSKTALRQAAHQMIQAGHLYLEYGYVQHALHCYAAVAPLYEEGWSRVDTHVQHSMSTQLAALGATKEASDALLKLTKTYHPTNPSQLLMSTLDPRAQGIIMRDLFRVVGAQRALNGDEEKCIKSMCIPTVIDSTLHTRINENPSESSSNDNELIHSNSGWSCIPIPTMSGRHPTAVRRVNEWEKLISASAWCRRGWNIMKSPTQHRDNLEYISTRERQIDESLPPQWCSVNEPVEIDFVLNNPLDVEIYLNDIVLTATIKREDDSENNDGNNLDLSTVSKLTLKPKSNTTLRMRVIPLSEGTLSIEGIQWRLCPTAGGPQATATAAMAKYGISEESRNNTILCLHEFDLLGRKLHDTRDHRATGARAKDTRLQVTVVGPRPWIGLKLATSNQNDNDSIENVVAGQLISLSLTLTNLGDASAKYITLSSSSDVVPRNVNITAANGNASLFRLPVTPLNPNESRTVELILRAPISIGKQDIYVMIEYSTEDDIPNDIITRALRLRKTLRRTRVMMTLNVVPSLTLDAFVRPTFDTTDEFIVRVDVDYPLLSSTAASASAAAANILYPPTSTSPSSSTSPTSVLSPPLRLRDLSSLSPRFILTRRSCDLDEKDIILQRGESMTLYYDVKVKEKGEEEEKVDDAMYLCNNLVSSTTTTASNWKLQDLGDITRTNDASSSGSDLTTLLCLDHVKSMVQAIKKHKRELKKVENELLGPTVGAQSIEDVRRRRNKLIRLKKELGMTAEEEEVPTPWDKCSLGWNAKSSIHLIALWEEAVEEKKFNLIQGLTTKLRIDIRPDRPNIKNPTRTCPLMLSCTYPEVVQHSFRASPCCKVPICVQITNGAPIGEKILKFTFDVASVDNNQFTWSGMTSKRLELKPGDTLPINLFAHFYGPGTYDINQFRFRLDVRQNNSSKEEVVSFKYPSLKYLLSIEEN